MQIENSRRIFLLGKWAIRSQYPGSCGVATIKIKRNYGRRTGTAFSVALHGMHPAIYQLFFISLIPALSVILSQIDTIWISGDSI
jgi:hypothetical protein